MLSIEKKANFDEEFKVGLADRPIILIYYTLLFSTFLRKRLKADDRQG